MAEPFLAEIRIFSFNFPPKGWAFCNGQTLPINQNTALFSLLGTTYGGNGTSNFQLPNAQGRVLAHPGLGLVQGEEVGEPNVTLTDSQIPAHSHEMVAGGVGTLSAPGGNFLGVPNVNVRLQNLYSTTGGKSAALQFIGSAGSGQSHTNLQPYLVLNFCIALQGIFPSRN